jgi:pimeloyl-ACP methyl ester carboxylesterase
MKQSNLAPIPTPAARLWKRSILVAALSLLAVYGMVRAVEYRNTSLFHAYMSRFTPVPEIGSFQEARSRAYSGGPRARRGVLLLHGYSASPQEFDLLCQKLQKAGIAYYAPQLTGFGDNDLGLLREVRAEDWMRDALNAYDTLAAFTDEVSVLGHSNGGALAVFVAEKRPVKHLILSGPNILPNKSDLFFKRLLNTWIVGSLVQDLLPVFRKPIRPGRVIDVDTLDPSAARRSFHDPALPTNSLRALWDVQDRVDITKARFADLTLLYGSCWVGATFHTAPLHTPTRLTTRWRIMTKRPRRMMW